jgi:hypothetical protein
MLVIPIFPSFLFSFLRVDCLFIGTRLIWRISSEIPHTDSVGFACLLCLKNQVSRKEYGGSAYCQAQGPSGVPQYGKHGTFLPTLDGGQEP